MVRRGPLYAIVLAVVAVGAADAQRRDLVGGAFDAKVVSVIDGDTIDALLDGDKRPIRIRLEGIDAPEAREPFSGQARSFARALLLDQRVRISGRDVDRYGRLVARVSVAGKDSSLQLIQAGLACHFTGVAPDPALAGAQSRARASGAGFWAAGAERPRCVWQPSAAPPLGMMAEAPNATPFHGNISSHVYHAASCPNYNCRNCTRVFRSEAEARAAGFKPAGDCLHK